MALLHPGIMETRPPKPIPTEWPAGRPLQKSPAAIIMDRFLDVGARARGPRRERGVERVVSDRV